MLKAGNTAGSGAGIYNADGGTLFVVNSQITHNTATGDGGGVANAKGTVTLVNSTVAFNKGATGGTSAPRPGKPRH